MKIIKLFITSIVLTLSVNSLFICGAYSQMNGQTIDSSSSKLATAFDNNTELFVIDNEDPVINVEENDTTENYSQDDTSQNEINDIPNEEDVVVDNTEESKEKEAYVE